VAVKTKVSGWTIGIGIPMGAAPAVRPVIGL
jgi:hypothetical protein